jgi:RimJ/RimL family protein N-acetyltransferase
MPTNVDFEASLQHSPVGSHTLLLQTRYPVVATARLRLRPFSLVDIAGLVSAVVARRIATTTLPLPRPFDAREAQHWIETHPLEWRKRCALHWVVSGLDHDRLCGYVGLNGIELTTGRAYLNVWIADRLARKELAFEASQAALAFAFNFLRLESVHAELLSTDPMMARVLRRLGMKSDAWHVSRATFEASLENPASH